MPEIPISKPTKRVADFSSSSTPGTKPFAMPLQDWQLRSYTMHICMRLLSAYLSDRHKGTYPAVTTRLRLRRYEVFTTARSGDRQKFNASNASVNVQPIVKHAMAYFAPCSCLCHPVKSHAAIVLVSTRTPKQATISRLLQAVETSTVGVYNGCITLQVAD